MTIRGHLTSVKRGLPGSVLTCSTLGCSAICVEASKHTASKLLENLSLNDIDAKVVVAAATSPQNAGTTLKLSIPPNNVGAASLGSNTKDFPLLEEKVPTFCVDQIVSTRELKRVRLIKIDVEGFELEVLKGSEILLEQKPPILFEWLGKKPGLSESELRHILPGDYQLFSINEHGRIALFDENRRYRNVIAITETDILCLKTEKIGSGLQRL